MSKTYFIFASHNIYALINHVLIKMLIEDWV